MTEIGLGHYLSLGAIIFFLGVIGIFLNRKNIIVILMSIELLLLAVNINLISFSIFSGDIVGQIFTMLILTCLLYTSPSPRDSASSRMPSSA